MARKAIYQIGNWKMNGSKTERGRYWGGGGGVCVEVHLGCAKNLQGFNAIEGGSHQ